MPHKKWETRVSLFLYEVPRKSSKVSAEVPRKSFRNFQNAGMGSENHASGAVSLFTRVRSSRKYFDQKYRMA